MGGFWMSLHEVGYAHMGGFYSLNPGMDDAASLNNGLEFDRPPGHLHHVNRFDKGQHVQDIEAEPEKGEIVKPKGRKKLAWVIVLVSLLGAGGAGAWLYFDPLKADPKEVESEESKLSRAPKLYFPLDPLVINLADLGGERFAQVGITFQIREAKSTDDVKKMLPTLRSAILITLSQKRSEELLSREGKEKLAADILLEVGRVFGVKPNIPQAEEVKPSKVAAHPPKHQPINPVLEVLFSSLIVQ